MNNRDLQKVSTSYLFGSLFNKGIAFFTVPIFTRLLSTSDYGIVTTYNSWIAILAMIVGFAMHTGIRIAFVDYRAEMDDFMATVTSFTLFSGAILSVIIIIASVFISTSLNSYLVVLCLLQSISSALIEDYSMYLMMQYRYKFRTALMVLPNFISTILSIFVIKFLLKHNLYLGMIIPTAFTLIIFGILVCKLVYSRSRCIYKKSFLKYALSFSLPLILHGIALNILSQSDRTMITWLASPSQTGIYSLIYNFSMIATVITTSLEGIWIPWFYNQLNNRKINEINIIARDYIDIMTYSLIGVVLVGPEVVKILATPNYWGGIKIIPPVVISNFIIFAYSLYVNIEHYHKKTKGITINTVIAAILNLILNYLFIPKFGYIAAAYTTLISYFVSFILHAVKSKKLEPNLYQIYYFVIPIFEICLATLIFYIFIDKSLIRWGILFLFIVIQILKKWNRIVIYFPKLNKKC